MPTPIYHITNINNLAWIVQTGGLWCDAERVRQGFQCVGIAHESLKQRRARTPVRDRAGRVVAAGGTLVDYVPFYFANRSPMLYSIHRGNVVGYAGGQAEVIYLVSSVERTVRAQMWYNTPDDPDRKRRKQAEFLVHGSVPWGWIHRIGVVDQGRSQRVREIIAGAPHQPEVTIEPGWYY